MFFTVPITVFTLGLFLLIINAVIIYVATLILPDFQVNSLGWAILFSLILSIITSLLERILGTRERQREE